MTTTKLEDIISSMQRAKDFLVGWEPVIDIDQRTKEVLLRDFDAGIKVLKESSRWSGARTSLADKWDK